MTDTTTVTAELPTDLYERFVASTTATETDEASLLAELVRDHVKLSESIATYTDHDGGGSALAGAGPGRLFEVPPPVGAFLGFDMVEMDQGRSVITFSAGPEHANPMGTLHGGVLCDVGDAAMGTAFASTLEEAESFTTLALDVKFLRPVWDAELTATGEVTERGRRTGLVECTIENEAGKAVAKLDSVCLVLRGEAAEGR